MDKLNIPLTERQQFDKIALPHILKTEGGYVNHPSDPGGATNRGITQGTYNAYLNKNGKKSISVRYIKPEQVADIYYSNYWVAAGCNKIPYPVNIAVFDWAVNAGAKQAITNLQEALLMMGYTLFIDGILGRDTLSAIPKAIAKYGVKKLVKEYVNKIKAYRKHLFIRNPKLLAFQEGWENRDNNLLSFVTNLA